jgi:hypothetical protein
MRRFAGPAVLGVILALPSCGEPDRSVEPGAAAAPCESVARLELRAEGHSFGTRCLAVPAGREVRASLESFDIEPHNFALYQDVPGSNQEDLSPPNLLVRSDNTFAGEPTDFRIPRLREGRYFFRCDFHPQMRGSLHAV